MSTLSFDPDVDEKQLRTPISKALDEAQKAMLSAAQEVIEMATM